MALRQALGRGARLGRGLLWRWLGGATPAPAPGPPAFLLLRRPPQPARPGFLREAAARLGLRRGPPSPGLLLFRHRVPLGPRRLGLAFSLGLALLEPALGEQRQAAEACHDIQVRAGGLGRVAMATGEPCVCGRPSALGWGGLSSASRILGVVVQRRSFQDAFTSLKE